MLQITKLFFGQVSFEIVFSTSLLATNYDEDTAGLLFLEKFEDVEIRFGPSAGWKLPIPSNWQRFRHLEITFLDDEIVDLLVRRDLVLQHNLVLKLNGQHV